MFDKLTVTVVAAVFLAAVSGSPALAQMKDKAMGDKAFQDCKVKGGWYQRDTGVCEIETNAKQAAMQKDDQICQAKGGWLQKETGVCEVETKAKK